VTASTGVADTGPVSDVRTDPGLLVGRGDELAVLRDSLERLRAGAGSGSGTAIALVGAAGVGKSRLARELLTVGRAADVPVLVGRAVPTASAVPYRAVRESLLSWSRTNPLPAAERLGGYARAIDHLLDEGVPDGQPLSPVFIAEAYLRLLTAIAADARGGGGAGCVVVLEDLHWADDETLAVVEYVADHAASTEVLAVLTSRNDEPGAARPVLEALGARASLRLLRLTPLDRDEVGELAVDLLGEPVAPALVQLLHERSEGVPLLVEELVTALRDADGLRPGPGGLDAAESAALVLPGSVADTVRVRLTALADDHRTVLETAAVFGRSFDWRRLAPVAQRPEAVVLEALRVGAEVHLLEADPARAGELRFRHALIRDAVAAATFPPQRTLLARRALDALLATTAPEDARDEEIALAVQLAALCDDHAVAAGLAMRAAWRAFDGWSLGTTERWLTRARRYAGTDPALLLEIDQLQIRVAGMVGRVDVVRTVGGALLARLPADDAEVRLDVHLRLAQAAAEEGAQEELREHLAIAQPLLATTHDACAVTRHALWSTVAGIGGGDLEEARRHGRRTIELAEPYDDQVDLHCAALMQLGRAALPDVTEARRLWQESLDLADRHTLRLWRGRLLAELAGLAVVDLEGDAELEEALALAHEAGAVELAQRVEVLLAELALLRGHPDETARHLDAADAIAARGTVAAPTRRRATELRGLLDALRGSPVPADASRCRRGVAALAADDLAAAQTLAAPGRPEARQAATYDHLLGLLVESAPAPGAELGRVGAGLGAARRAIAAAAAGSAGEARTVLVEAHRLLEPAPWLQAFAVRLAARAVVERTGDAGDTGETAGETPGNDEVRALLRDAAATFDGIGLVRPADACRALLQDTGAAVPRRQSAQAGVPDRLRTLGVTARELDVLRLVAEGLTSRDIAERLYLSHRTVEKHVERLLAKTGAANRTALAALARTT
jgi:ATP/maltotriose-dependent transcriptional regulator MalT